ncbi:MAG: hypothetical protein JW874_00500 [Spirochaetales bacterium]|nr:hypothetical protein [Spirochaetales bacterium]
MKDAKILLAAAVICFCCAACAEKPDQYVQISASYLDEQLENGSTIEVPSNQNLTITFTGSDEDSQMDFLEIMGVGYADNCPEDLDLTNDVIQIARQFNLAYGESLPVVAYANSTDSSQKQFNVTLQTYADTTAPNMNSVGLDSNGCIGVDAEDSESGIALEAYILDAEGDGFANNTQRVVNSSETILDVASELGLTQGQSYAIRGLAENGAGLQSAIDDTITVPELDFTTTPDADGVTPGLQIYREPSATDLTITDTSIGSNYTLEAVIKHGSTTIATGVYSGGKFDFDFTEPFGPGEYNEGDLTATVRMIMGSNELYSQSFNFGVPNRNPNPVTSPESVSFFQGFPNPPKNLVYAPDPDGDAVTVKLVDPVSDPQLSIDGNNDLVYDGSPASNGLTEVVVEDQFEGLSTDFNIDCSY